VCNSVSNQFVLPTYTLEVGCTNTNVGYSYAEDFVTAYEVINGVSVLDVYKIIEPVSNRTYCNLVKHEVIEAKYQDVLQADAASLSTASTCATICDLVDIFSSNVMGSTIKFKIRS